MLVPCWAHVEPFLCNFWFVLAFVGQELGPYWADLGPFWAMLAPYWAHAEPFWSISVLAFVQSCDHIGVILGHFGYFCAGVCWARVVTMLGLSWAILGFWAILNYFGVCVGLCWARVGIILGLSWAISARLWHFGTILGSCWAILGYFRVVVGLCLRLGHFSVVESWSCWSLFWSRAFHCRWLLVLWAFILDLGISVSAMLGCCCILFSPCWANVDSPWSNICLCWVMSGNVGRVYVVIYGNFLLVLFRSGFRSQFKNLTEKFLYKIHRVDIDTCLTVYLNFFCTYLYYLTAEPW